MKIITLSWSSSQRFGNIRWIDKYENINLGQQSSHYLEVVLRRFQCLGSKCSLSEYSYHILIMILLPPKTLQVTLYPVYPSIFKLFFPPSLNTNACYIPYQSAWKFSSIFLCTPSFSSHSLCFIRYSLPFSLHFNKFVTIIISLL